MNRYVGWAAGLLALGLLGTVARSRFRETAISRTEDIRRETHPAPAITESPGKVGLPKAEQRLSADEVARELAEDATFRLKTLLQDAHKFMVHAKRKQLLCEDIDLALRSEGEILLLPKHSDHQSFYLYIVSIKFGFRDKVCVLHCYDQSCKI